MSVSNIIRDKDMISYRKMEGKLLKEHHGKVAIFYKGKLIALGKNIAEAFRKAKIPDGEEVFIKEILEPKEQAGVL